MYPYIYSIAQHYFPTRLYKSLIGNLDKNGLKKYFSNTSWILLAKVITFLVSFFTLAVVARYLGPENYGKISYAQSFVAIFSIFASFGIDLVVYRDLVAHPEKEREILGTAVLTKLVFGSITFLVTVCTASIVSEDALLTWLIGIIALSFIFQPFGTVGHVFSARVISQYPAYISIATAIFIPILKLLVIYFDKGVYYFATILLFEAIIGSLAIILMYLYVTKESPLDWTCSFASFKKMILESWPLLLAGFSGYIYARIDQVMIHDLIDVKSVGMYDAAVRLTEPLSFLPGIIIGSVFPAVINAKKTNTDEYRSRLRKLTFLCLGISFTFILIVFIFSNQIIHLVFGQAFSESVIILRVYVWSNLGTVAMSLMFNYFIAEHRNRAFLFYTVSGAVINVCLNLYLIPKMGAIGAAYATVATLALMISIFLLKEGRNKKLSG